MFNLIFLEKNNATLSVKLDMLSPAEFPNGSMYFLSDYFTRYAVTPFIVHNNYIMGFDEKNQQIQASQLMVHTKI